MRLLIISASGRALAASAIKAGFSVDVVDLFADWDLRQLCLDEPKGVHKAWKIGDFFQVLEFDWLAGCEASIIAGGFENRIELVRELELKTKLLGPGSRQLADLLSPESQWEIANVVVRAGGRYPETRMEIGAQDMAHRWLKKKLNRAGGLHVMPVTAADIAGTRPNKLRAISSSEGEIFQRRIEGQHISGLFAATNSDPFQCQLLGCTTQLVGEPWTGASQFSYCGSIGPLTLAAEISNTIQRIGSAIADKFEIVGVFGIDMIVNDAGVWPVDINPRIPASAEIYELAGERFAKKCETSHREPFSVVATHVAACSGEVSATPRFQNNGPFNGKAVLFCRNPSGIKIDFQCFEILVGYFWSPSDTERPDRERPDRWIADIPNVGTTIRPGEPVLTLFVTVESDALVWTRLKSFADELSDRLNLQPLKK